MVLSLDTRISLVKNRKRVGRGGKRGGTSCRGNKGQNCRSGGGVGVTFEGGQMPLTRRLPKRGFCNVQFQDEWEVINIGRLHDVFEDGQEVTRQMFVERGFVGPKSKARIKILGKGELSKRLVVEADAFSASAEEAIKKHGGEVRLIKER